MQLIILSISLLLFIPYVLLIFFYRHSWVNIPTTYLPPEKQLAGSITVIVSARNEEKNIKKCLDSILNQTYTAAPYEIIVVNDFSTDATVAIVKTYHGKVKLISLNDHLDSPINSYKKKAIEIAIAQSSGDIITITDADCIVPTTWIQNIAYSFFNESNQTDPTVFIVAPVSYTSKNKFIHIFQSLDFMTLQGITGASVNKKIHSMCNGANLAYRKKVFYEVNGFDGIDNIASGDDMLLMHKIFKRYPEGIKFLKSTQAIVCTKPMDTLKDFFHQRIRWASKADNYDDKRIFFVLMLVYLFNVLLLMLPLQCLLHNYQLSIFNFQFSLFSFWFLLLICKTIIELIFLYPVATFFNQQKLLWWFLAAQPFHIFYTVIAGWLGKFGSYQWKERKVK
jgi:cellulose synthase/poly-beta-1,6-N-acetylglucosamine synthase-like glycosyltransferase